MWPQGRPCPTLAGDHLQWTPHPSPARQPRPLAPCRVGVVCAGGPNPEPLRCTHRLTATPPGDGGATLGPYKRTPEAAVYVANTPRPPLSFLTHGEKAVVCRSLGLNPDGVTRDMLTASWDRCLEAKVWFLTRGLRTMSTLCPVP